MPQLTDKHIVATSGNTPSGAPFILAALLSKSDNSYLKRILFTPRATTMMLHSLPLPVPRYSPPLSMGLTSATIDTRPHANLIPTEMYADICAVFSDEQYFEKNNVRSLPTSIDFSRLSKVTLREASNAETPPEKPIPLYSIFTFAAPPRTDLSPDIITLYMHAREFKVSIFPIGPIKRPKPIEYLDL